MHLFVYHVRYPITVLQIWVQCQCYAEEHLARHHHGLLYNIFGEDWHGMYAWHSSIPKQFVVYQVYSNSRILCVYIRVRYLCIHLF